MSEIVRGEGHAPGQGPGEVMPTVQTTERASLDSMRDHFARKNEEAEARARGGGVSQRSQPNGQPQTTSSRIGEFSKQLEQRQQQMANGADPNAPVPQEGETEQTQGEEQSTEGDKPAEGEEAAAALAVDDKTALEKFREWSDSDLFPDEMADKWLHELTVSGQTKYVDTKELRQGYMRGGDARKMYTEAQTMDRRAAAREQAFQQHFEAIRDPKTFLEMYSRNGYGREWKESVAKLIASEVRDRRGICEAAGLAAMHRIGVNDWNHVDVQRAMATAEQNWNRMQDAGDYERRLQFERDQLTQQQQQTTHQQQTEQHKAHYDAVINQLRPVGFRAHGIKDTPANRQAMYRHIGNVVSPLIAAKQFDGNLTREHILQAAQDLREELDDELAGERALDNPAAPPQGTAANVNGTRNGMTAQQQRAAQQAAARRSRALGGNRMGIGGGKPMGGAASQKRGSLDDLEAMVRRSRDGG